MMYGPSYFTSNAPVSARGERLKLQDGWSVFMAYRNLEEVIVNLFDAPHSPISVLQYYGKRIGIMAVVDADHMIPPEYESVEVSDLATKPIRSLSHITHTDVLNGPPLDLTVGVVKGSRLAVVPARAIYPFHFTEVYEGRTLYHVFPKILVIEAHSVVHNRKRGDL